MLKFDKISGLQDDDDWMTWRYKMRDKESDMEATREYHKKHPPKVGDLVVILHTASHHTMMKPHITQIKAITDRGRIVVDHDHEAWAGKSFWKSGQNCKAPKGQCWLIPAELYRDIPMTRETEKMRLSEQYEDECAKDQLSVAEMSKMLGGGREFVHQMTILISEFKLNKEQAKEHLSRELQSERQLSGQRNQFGKRITRQMIRDHMRYFLAQGHNKMQEELRRENRMIEKGRMRSEGRRKQWQ